MTPLMITAVTGEKGASVMRGAWGLSGKCKAKS